MPSGRVSSGANMRRVSDGTREALNRLCRSEHDLHDTLDVLLTVATLPGHPLNAVFLDRRLRKETMPDRDACWSTYLHQAWGTHGAVDRLVDWASSQGPNTSIDDETVDLCAITLSWMFTTSNRFLRDRATKALVSLLTGRLAAGVRLIERFADVDDPYVAERIYAVAYGVAMRCHDPVAAGALAACVYGRVFASGSPPPHILLRDYARGVVDACPPSRVGYRQWPAIESAHPTRARGPRSRPSRTSSRCCPTGLRVPTTAGTSSGGETASVTRSWMMTSRTT